MGSEGTFWYGFWEEDPEIWARCRAEATRQMVAEGWKTYANKFNRVMQKRALKLWAKIK
jgi:hypothetical protein